MPTLGPLQFATLRCNDAKATADLYKQYLRLEIKRQDRISPELAAMLGSPMLANAPCLWLGSPASTPWLRILELPTDEPATPLKRQGWMSLEVSVANVDKLATQLEGSPFTIIGDPADLAFNDSIRAMQVIGPAQEVLYLTEIKTDIPQFQLQPAESWVDKLFIMVLATADRQTSSNFYHNLGAEQPVLATTRIGVLNRAWEKDADHEYPIAVIQLAGRSLLEIDHLPEASPLATEQYPPSGIASVGVGARNLNLLTCSWQTPIAPISDYPWHGRNGACARGPDGEWLEFVEQPD